MVLIQGVSFPALTKERQPDAMPDSACVAPYAACRGDLTVLTGAGQKITITFRKCNED